VLAAPLAGYVGICWLLYAQQDRLLYPGAADSNPSGFAVLRIPSGPTVYLQYLEIVRNFFLQTAADSCAGRIPAANNRGAPYARPDAVSHTLE
jgi:hypothetical protein